MVGRELKVFVTHRYKTKLNLYLHHSQQLKCSLFLKTFSGSCAILG